MALDSEFVFFPEILGQFLHILVIELKELMTDVKYLWALDCVFDGSIYFILILVLLLG